MVTTLFAEKMALVAADDDAAWDTIVFEAEQFHKSANNIFTATHARLVKGPNGQASFIVGATHDISERKRSEKEKASLEAQLHHAQKMEAVGRLAGGIAHDFNNVLCAITGNVEIALEELSEQDSLREPMEDTLSAANQAASLTRQLLAFSRKQIIAPKVIDLSQVLTKLRPMLVRLIGEDLDLKISPKKELGMVRADPGQIEQIVLNLAINARDAMPKGGELHIDTGDLQPEPKFFTIHPQAKPGNYVLLKVRDTGSGMGPDVLEKIFEPFFTTKEQGQGTGLGLATVYGIVEQNGGFIEVESEQGTGTTFRLYFPQVHDEADDISLPKTMKAKDGHETILVVEDEDMVRTMARRILTRRGYNVICAAFPNDAIDLLKHDSRQIDLLLTDVIMPQMNGRVLAAKISEMRPEIKVLFCSGYAQNVVVHRGELDDDVEFIAKPYSPDSLASRVREILDASETKAKLS